MRCDICMLVKPLDEFSKNSRRNGEYVRRCVAWTEIQEPSLTPGPLETGHISPEEEQQRTLRQRFVMSQDFFPDDDDDLVPQVRLYDHVFMLLSESYRVRRVWSAAIDEFLSRADDASSTRSIVLPPHLRSKYKAVSEAASCTSSTAGDVSLPTTLLESDSDTASIVSRSFNVLSSGYEAELWGFENGVKEILQRMGKLASRTLPTESID
ncbi:hypothetical protein MY1884_009443 [Beauveria asiatica]